MGEGGGGGGLITHYYILLLKYNYNYDDNEGKKYYYEDKNWWYEKNINFCEKNDDERNKYMKFEDWEWKRHTHKFKQCTLHFTIENKLYS